MRGDGGMYVILHVELALVRIIAHGRGWHCTLKEAGEGQQGGTVPYKRLAKDKKGGIVLYKRLAKDNQRCSASKS